MMRWWVGIYTSKLFLLVSLFESNTYISRIPFVKRFFLLSFRNVPILIFSDRNVLFQQNKYKVLQKKNTKQTFFSSLVHSFIYSFIVSCVIGFGEDNKIGIQFIMIRMTLNVWWWHRWKIPSSLWLPFVYWYDLQCLICHSFMWIIVAMVDQLHIVFVPFKCNHKIKIIFLCLWILKNNTEIKPILDINMDPVIGTVQCWCFVGWSFYSFVYRIVWPMS